MFRLLVMSRNTTSVSPRGSRR